VRRGHRDNALTGNPSLTSELNWLSLWLFETLNLHVIGQCFSIAFSFYGGTGPKTTSKTQGLMNLGPHACSITWATLLDLFCVGYFRDRVSQSICLCWLWSEVILTSASWVARIIGVSHWHPAHCSFVHLTTETFSYEREKEWFCLNVFVLLLDSFP
jgi:hypothetical protein